MKNEEELKDLVYSKKAEAQKKVNNLSDRDKYRYSKIMKREILREVKEDKKPLAKKFLKEASRESVYAQKDERKAIVNAFETFWKSNPDREEFGEVLDGIARFPELFYIMSKTHTKSNFKGSVDEVELHNEALEDDEVMKKYEGKIKGPKVPAGIVEVGDEIFENEIIKNIEDMESGKWYTLHRDFDGTDDWIIPEFGKWLSWEEFKEEVKRNEK